MKVFEQISEIRKARWEDPSLVWGLVPTMGFLHEGHISLVKRAKSECDRVGVSIFVNPTQFGQNEDFDSYPRDLKRDLDMLEKEGVDLVWTPEKSTVYPKGYKTYVNVEEITDLLEGEKRPGHFKGVCTVVAKLFNVFEPHKSYFGQKDAQQAAVITKMADDLNFHTEVIICPTVREEDGLAMSSRNSYLSKEQRKSATVLYRSLCAAIGLYKSGEHSADALKKMVEDVMATEPDFNLEYISVADFETLKEIKIVNKRVLVSMAAKTGKIRLIDNMIIEGD